MTGHAVPDAVTSTAPVDATAASDTPSSAIRGTASAAVPVTPDVTGRTAALVPAATAALGAPIGTQRLEPFCPPRPRPFQTRHANDASPGATPDGFALRHRLSPNRRRHPRHPRSQISVLPLWVIVAADRWSRMLLALAAYGIWRWRQWRRRPRVLLPFEQALAATRRASGLSCSPPAHVSSPLRCPTSFAVTSSSDSTSLRRIAPPRNSCTICCRPPKPSLARHRGLLADFLQQCDLVKFGGMSRSRCTASNRCTTARAASCIETAKPDPVILPNPKEAHDTLPAA